MADVPETEGAGFVISLDRDLFHTVDGCICLKGADFTQDSTRDKVLHILDGRLFDCVLSDMAPNATGHKLMDHEQIIDLQLKFAHFSTQVLKDGGTLVCKLWEGNRTRHLTTYLDTLFNDVKIFKPDASRSNSAELFVLARRFELPE